MKLRNKKTGEIITLKDEGELALLKLIENALPIDLSLWEEIEEPLIKDEKIRKAVRAWAEANNYSLVKVSNDMASEPNYGNLQIHFEDADIVDEDKYGVHTIAELCGEEEE